MKIALCVIATGKYTRFLADLLLSAEEFFCAGHDVEFFVFSDNCPLLTAHCPLTTVHCQHEPWPGPTLHRYRTMLQAAAELSQFDYVYYCDVDMLFTGCVGVEIFGELTAVLHPGFFNKPRIAYTYEYRPNSRAYVAAREGSHYFAGGFQGGTAAAYLTAMQEMAARIEDDERRGMVAVWHDESHWNRYLIDHRPHTILPPLYCSPESWNTPGRRLVARDKDHAEVRA